LRLKSFIGKAFRMSDETHKNMSREDRLAAKLRENLHRRKAQAREMTESTSESLPKPRSKS
jgi:hypothetical protein